MKDLVRVMGDVNLAAFWLLAAACAVQCRRGAHRSIWWATAAFTTLATLGLVGLGLRYGWLPALSLWPTKLILVILAFFPYLLYRFVAAFEPAPRPVEVIANVATGAVAVATLLLPALPVPVPGLEDPPWWGEYRVVLLTQWTFLFSTVGVRLWWASRDQVSVPRKRLRTLAVAAGGLNAAVLLSGVGLVTPTDRIRVAISLLFLLSAVLFFVGMAPPRWLVTIWRQPVIERIQAGMRELFLAETQAEVTAAMLPHAAMIGARGAALVSPAGALLGTFGETDEPARIVALAQALRLPVGMHRLQLQAGTLLVWRSKYAPFFGRGDLDTLAALGHFSDIVMDRCALVEGQRQTKQELAFQATHDHLTGLPNRVLLYDRLTQVLARAGAQSGAVAVLFLDVDRFKVINDSLGHSSGDEVLQVVAHRLLGLVRPGDTVARFGGDEFVVVAEGPFAGDDPGALAARIAESLSHPVEVDGTTVVVTASIGLAVAHPGDDAESLLRDADAAMYRAKEGGRDRCLVFDAAMRASAERRLFVESALRRAIDSGQLSMRYQPVIELASGRIVGMEALARCEMDGEELQPSEFIPVAEETGLIIPLGALVLRRACEQLVTWQRDIPGVDHLSISVNRSARELLMPGASDAVAATLAAVGLEPSSLCLEITESVLLEDAQSSARALNALKRLGVSIAVDDFGTGYSSLTYLKQFPVDTLKIDRSFVAGLVDVVADSGDRAIVAGVIDLAHAFGMTTIAEGVETHEQLSRLHQLGCELAQGYLLGGPMDVEEAGWWLQHAHAEMGAALPAATLSPGRVRVLVVDDDRALRTLLGLLLEDHPAYEVVAAAPDGREAIALARHHQPDLVLLDLAMPGVGGLEALPLIRAVAPDTKVIVVSGLEPADVEAEAVARGAVGFVSKELGPERVLGELGRILTPA